MSDSSRFPLFHNGQVFHHLVCLLTVVLPQIFFNLTTLFSYPVSFSLFHAPLDVVVHFLVFLRSFRLKFFLSQFSPFVAQIKKLYAVIQGFFFWRCLPRISLAVSVIAVLKVVITESRSESSVRAAAHLSDTTATPQASWRQGCCGLPQDFAHTSDRRSAMRMNLDP